MILGLLGCTIFCITNADDEKEFDTQSSSNPKYHSFQKTKEQSNNYQPPTQHANLNGKSQNNISEKEAPKSTWDPEKGEIWQGGEDPYEVEMQQIPHVTPQTSDNNYTGDYSQPQQQKQQHLQSGIPTGTQSSTDEEKLIEPTLSEVADLD